MSCRRPKQENSIDELSYRVERIMSRAKAKREISEPVRISSYNQLIRHFFSEVEHFGRIPLSADTSAFVKSVLDNRTVIMDSHDLSVGDNFVIIWASLKGRSALVERLVGSGLVDPSAQSNMAIIYACVAGHTDVVTSLLKDPRVDPSAQGNRAIVRACKYGRTSVVKTLLDDPRVDPSAKNDLALRYACLNGRLEVVKLLLQDHRVDPSSLKSEAMILASRNGNTEVTLLMLKDGRANPRARKGFVFMNAISRGKTEVVRLLLQDGRVRANGFWSINGVDFEYPVVLASIRGHTDIVYMLLGEGRADPSVRDNIVLMNAISRDEREFIDMILDDERVDINTLCDAGAEYGRQYPIVFASILGRTDIVSLFLEWNSTSFDVLDKAIEVARDHGNNDIADMISSHIEYEMLLEENRELDEHHVSEPSIYIHRGTLPQRGEKNVAEVA